jgi:hypothetical protein
LRPYRAAWAAIAADGKLFAALDGGLMLVPAGGPGRGERVAAFTPGGGMAEVAIAAADVTVEVPRDVPPGTAISAVSLAQASGKSRCWSGPGMRLSRRKGAGRRD